MCGIFGVIKTSKQLLPSEIKKYTDQSLRVGTLRGGDSVGLIFGQYGKDVDWIKRTGTGEGMVECPEYIKKAEAVEGADYIIGHHRAGTLGAVSVDNAHPFAEGGVVMVHNGTLRGEYAFSKLQQRNVQVDSHVLCHELAETAPEDSHKVLADVSGAYCVVWHDSRDNTVNMARNYERPLHVFHTKDKQNILFSSEAGMGAWLIERINITALYTKQLDAMEVHKYYMGCHEPVVYTIKKPWVGGHQTYTHRGVPAAPPAAPPVQALPAPARPAPTALRPKMVELLRSVGVTEEFRVAFTPMSIMGTSLMLHSKKEFSLGAVVGTIDSLQMAAIIHTTNYKGASSMFDGRWLVRPSGVLFDPTGKPFLICKQVKRPGQWRPAEIVETFPQPAEEHVGDSTYGLEWDHHYSGFVH